ncbi:hypothetical protein F3087_45695 [Nocardia colli]|uniref:Uncharacterized protein n=1 Tax=Nocardia colli TaxID=2545717 RepID=A0A5N0DMN5_9NOCA|nr:hypothetical protein [Nocardia colli]KAA8877179.1 hypothetical protein F3087_45695 [Nocardia colli]
MGTGKDIPPVSPELMQQIMARIQKPQAGKGKAWQKVAEAAAESLGSDWIVTGSRMKTSLVRTPIRWWYQAIGFAPSTVNGQLGMEYQPLVRPIRAGILGHHGGIRQSEYPLPFQRQSPNFRADAPREIPVFDTDAAVDTVIWWATGPAKEIIEWQTDRQWADRDEKAYATRTPSVRPIVWTALPGWRVLFDTGSPLPIIDSIITELIDGEGLYDEERDFWMQFRELAAAEGDRAVMLRFLDEQRRRSLIEHCGVPESAIADVLTEQD